MPVPTFDNLEQPTIPLWPGPAPAVDRTDDVLRALGEGEGDPLRQWLAGFGVDVGALWDLPHWSGAETGEHLPSQRRGPTDLRQRAPLVLDGALRAVSAVPGAAPRLGLYLLHACEQIWEISYHYQPIWTTLREAGRRWGASGLVHPADRVALDVVLRQLAVLDLEIRVENEMVCGCRSRMAAVAREAARQAQRVREAAGAIQATHPDVAAYLTDRAESTAVYNTAVAIAASALDGYLAEPGYPLGEQVAALAEIEAGAEEMATEDRSEIRAHRMGLETLRRAAEVPWLTVDEGTVVYVYPFAVRGVTMTDLIRRVRAEAEGWDLAGVVPTGVNNSLPLDDAWDGSDAFGRRYDGAQVTLPDVVVADLDGGVLARLKADLRFSTLGNHYLRLEGPLHEAGPADIRAALFRAAPEHGTAVVSCARVTDVDSTVDMSRGRWQRLSGYAVDVIESVGRAMRLPDGVSTRPGMFHVLVTVLDASTGIGPAVPRQQRQAVESAEQVIGAFGAAALFHPVPNCVSSVAEWGRYPLRATPGAVDAAGLRDDLMVRTTNTTVLVAPGSPGWALGTRQSVAEFVASLEGLFAGWFDQLAAFRTRVIEKIPDFGAGGTPLDVDELARYAALLEEEQIRLHQFVGEARAIQALLRSPGLVASPVVGDMLVNLLDAAGLHHREREFAAKVEEVLDERLNRRIDALAKRRAEEAAREATLRSRVAERRARRQRARLDTMLAVIAAVGVSGLGQILQAGYDLDDLTSIWLVVAIVFLAVAVGGYTWLSGWRDGRDPGRGGRDPERGGRDPERGEE